jgi:hypothetical protein
MTGRMTWNPFWKEVYYDRSRDGAVIKFFAKQGKNMIL